MRLEQGRDCYDLIDLVRLASVEEVRAGTVPLVSSLGTSEPLCYTPQTYVSHLKNILRILDAHGATIEATSQPGQGSTFTLRFPKANSSHSAS